MYQRYVVGFRTDTLSALQGEVALKQWARGKPNLPPFPFIFRTTPHAGTCFCPYNDDWNQVHLGKRPSHHRSCASLRYHICLLHRDAMCYGQRVVTTASWILSVRIIGSLHQVFNFFRTFSTMFIIVKQQNDSIESIAFCALIQTHFFTAMYLITAFIFQFF